ncbi:MAG: cache domain-containing protein [Desulfosarcinaceae bacterium]|jgi:signal transduction histidine kinase
MDYADQDGKKFFIEMAQKAKRGRGWVKYKWPLPKTEEIKQKYTYIYRVPNTDYFVGSGFYDMGAGVYQ